MLIRFHGPHVLVVITIDGVEKIHDCNNKKQSEKSAEFLYKLQWNVLLSTIKREARTPCVQAFVGGQLERWVMHRFGRV